MVSTFENLEAEDLQNRSLQKTSIFHKLSSLQPLGIQHFKGSERSVAPVCRDTQSAIPNPEHTGAPNVLN